MRPGTERARMLQSVSDRRGLAARLRELKHGCAAAVTEELLRANPSWLERFGEAARVRGIEDTEYHIDFLASAIETGLPEAFSDYARWTTRVLASRGIEPRLLAESLLQIGETLAPELDDEDRCVVGE